MARKRLGQVAFEFPNNWGGRRKGSGRKPKGRRAGLPHRPRAPLASRFPVHVTVSIHEYLPSLRSKRVYRVLRQVFQAGCEREGFRLNHYSVQCTHLHLIVEAANRERLARGMQGLLVRMSRGLNKLWGRKGAVVADRFHDHVLRTPWEVRNALAYVLNNARKHGALSKRDELDPYSSGRWFDGWRESFVQSLLEAPIARARTWLLNVGWRRHGRIGLSEVPSSG